MVDAEPARKSTAEIYRTLRERICLLQLPPGSRLTEQALAAEFGVSRTPIREVLERLQHDRLVTQRPGAGTSVAIIDTKEVRDVWAVRLKIAELLGDFVRLPAPTAVVDELEAIRAELAQVRTTGDVLALAGLYNRSHEAVLAVVDNETLRRIHDQLYHQTSRVWLQFLPEMDLGAEIDVMSEEVSETIVAMQGRSGSELSRIRAMHLRMLLTRFNDHVARPIG